MCVKVGIEVALRYVKEVVAEFTLQISRAISTTTKKGGELKWQ